MLNQLTPYHYLLKSFFITASLVCSGWLLYSQQVTVGGKPRSSELSWSDFSYRVPEGSRFDANTACKVIPSVSHVKLSNGLYAAEKVEVAVELDTSRTWARAEARTPQLLQHEQGHLYIFMLCARNMADAIRQTTFTKAQLDQGLKELIQRIMDEYKTLHQRYDSETQFHANSQQQQKWSDWLLQQFLKNTYSLKGPQ